MTQRLFTGLFIFIFAALYIGLTYIVDEVRLSHFVVIWVMLGVYAGQYSTKFPKE